LRAKRLELALEIRIRASSKLMQGCGLVQPIALWIATNPQYSDLDRGFTLIYPILTAKDDKTPIWGVSLLCTLPVDACRWPIAHACGAIQHNRRGFRPHKNTDQVVVDDLQPSDRTLRRFRCL
jgi:hypothetical protein